MKDTQLKVLAIINLVWIVLGMISTLGSTSDTVLFELVFEGLIMWMCIRLLTKLK